MIRKLLLAFTLVCAPTLAVAQTTYPTPAGSRVNGVVPLQCDASGANCAPSSAASPTIVSDGSSAPTNGASDGVSTAVLGDTDNVRNYVFNGTTWDRARGDTTGAYNILVPSASANAGTTLVATSAAASSLVAKGTAGTLYGINVTAGASAGYVMLFNATTAPADGAVAPLRCIPLAANTGIEINLRGQPVYLAPGIVIVFSTTGCFTKTASATAFIAADVK